MKKIVSIVLLCFLILICFAGCSVKDDNTVQGNTEQETQKTQENAPIELKGDDELVLAIIEYLKELNTSCDIGGTTTEEKIDEIKNGQRALYMEFDATSFYFVCGYYDGYHKHGPICDNCAQEYTWVKFENVNEISKKYKGSEFVVAIQINEASYVADITDPHADVPCVEHFQLYEPLLFISAFESEVNTYPPLTYNRAFIYLNAGDKSNVYHFGSPVDHQFYTIPCFFLDEQYYLQFFLNAVDPDGNRYQDNDALLICDLGKYYADLMSIMDKEKYSVTDEMGNTRFYGLIKINDFIKFIDELSEE